MLLMTKHFHSTLKKKNRLCLISAGDSNTHLSVNVYLTTYADYVNTLFDYFSHHQSHPIKVGTRQFQ